MAFGFIGLYYGCVIVLHDVFYYQKKIEDFGRPENPNPIQFIRKNWDDYR
jgi:hypothetical protein